MGLLELSEGLYNMARNEKNLVTAMFERETRREKILDARQKEIRLKERSKTEGSKAEGEDEKAEEEPYEEEDLYEKAEKEFFSIIEAEKKKQPTPSQDFAEVEKAGDNQAAEEAAAEETEAA